ncbi:MAG TPA: LuxR C-terminal-related transcriptional regulator [Thermomicrobiales bacterium]|nr:LuxR C-terminal-related transcriptional regulator [Thermomicrobiales bacterium]
MATTTTAEERVFAEVQRLCYAGLDAPTLHRRALACLGRVVPFDSSCTHDADPASGLMIRMYLDPPNEPAARFFIEHVYFEDAINDFNWMIRARQPVARLSETTGGQVERSLRYRAAIAPRGFHFDLRGVFAAGREHWGGLTLLRERGRRDFSAREGALIGRVGPHLAAGLKAAVLRAQAPLAVPGEGPGVLVLDARGRVVQYTASAERWLRELGELGPGWQEGDGLPGAVWLAVGALRHALRSATERERARPPRIATQARTGRWLALQAALAEGRDGRAAETVIVLEPVGPRELTWLRTTAYDLSAREREVVELVMRGASTRQIAATLSIAEYTVQAHLSHIFDKVGVRGRRALVQRLYLDSLYPAP